MRLVSGIAAASLGLVALPAHAADLATIDCVIAKLQPALTTLIETDVTRNLGESGKRPTYDPAIGSGLRIAAAACAIEHKWSEAAISAARIYTLAKLGWPIAQRVVAEKGFDAAALEDQFQALPEEARNRPLTTTEAQGLVMASVTDEAKQTRENAELLNEFFLFASTIQFAAFDFSQA